jgi:hypothetical protein
MDMILVLKNNIIIATHSDSQENEIKQLYDEDCVQIIVSDDYIINSDRLIDLTIDIVKLKKITELEKSYKLWQDAGWYDSVNNITLFLQDSDQINYMKAKLVYLFKPDNHLCDFGTTTGWIQVEKYILMDILERYGDDASIAFKKLSDLTNYVKYVCQTIEQVELVNW